MIWRLTGILVEEIEEEDFSQSSTAAYELR